MNPNDQQPQNNSPTPPVGQPVVPSQSPSTGQYQTPFSMSSGPVPQKSKKRLIIIIVSAIVLLALIVAAILLVTKQSPADQTNNDSTAAVADADGNFTLENDFISFKYPEGWKVQQNEDYEHPAGPAFTIVLTSADYEQNEQFQIVGQGVRITISMVPTEGRTLTDYKSMLDDQPTDTTVDGNPAFLSTGEFTGGSLRDATTVFEDNLYRIEREITDEGNADAANEVLDQVISSFQLKQS